RDTYTMDKKDGDIYVRNEKEIFRVNRKQFRKLQKSYHDNPGFFHNGAYEEDGSSIKLKSKPYNPIELE
ncbi:GLPGLI family protein, partial [Elizabethkingia ursingii]|nr:GLPGLI family protein [Elizabethkingia ursingii]